MKSPNAAVAASGLLLGAVGHSGRGDHEMKTSSLIRGKYVIGRIIGDDRAELIEDGAIFQRGGKIIEEGE